MSGDGGKDTGHAPLASPRVSHVGINVSFFDGHGELAKLRDLATQREVLTLQGQGEYFLRVAFSPDGSTVMGTSFVGVAHLWRAPSWEEIAAAEKGGETP